MLSRRALVVMWMASGPSERRMALPPRGRGRPVCSRHHWPRSRILTRPSLGVGELAFVDDEAGVVLAGEDGGDDLVEGDDDGLDVGGEELEGEVGGGEGAGDGDAESF